MAPIGRPRSCDCGKCAKCERREQARARYQALSRDERRELIAKRDKEKARASDRARYYRHRDMRLARMRDWFEKNREKAYKSTKEHDLRNPDKYRARTAVSNAIRDGKLMRQPCEKCGDPKSHAHHPDYSKPLEVVWLCATHHGEEHRRYEPPAYNPRREAA